MSFLAFSCHTQWIIEICLYVCPFFTKLSFSRPDTVLYPFLQHLLGKTISASSFLLWLVYLASDLRCLFLVLIPNYLLLVCCSWFLALYFLRRSWKKEVRKEEVVRGKGVLGRGRSTWKNLGTLDSFEGFLLESSIENVERLLEIQRTWRHTCTGLPAKEFEHYLVGNRNLLKGHK